MTVDELEAAPDPRKVRNPLSRRPEPPVRVEAALRSLKEDRAFSIRRPTEDEALAVRSEITAAVYYLCRWEGYDVRVRPYVTRHALLDGEEWIFHPGTKKVARGWYRDSEYLTEAAFDRAAGGKDREEFFRTNFWVHPPMERGFRKMSEDKVAAAHEQSAKVRGVKIKAR